jgi:hypothetical protein
MMSEEMTRYDADNTTISDEYKLTPVEQRLLETLLNPESAGKSVTEKCQMANISRDMYYRIMKKPEFKSLLSKTAVDLVRDKIADVLAASIKAATTGGVKGYQDRRMLLEMFGIAVKEDDNRIVIANIRN